MTSNRDVLCARCGEKGHRTAGCPLPFYRQAGGPVIAGYPRGRAPECHNCGELGHIKSKCPQYRQSRATTSGELTPAEKLVLDQMTEIYKGLHTGYGISDEEKDLVKSNGGSDTYGELPPASSLRLARALSLRADDVFCDLGSGVGKVCLAVALATNVLHSFGLELAETRVQSNLDAIKKANLGHRCGAYVEDFLTSPRLLEATVCYCCNCTLGNDIFALVVQRMINDMPRLRLLATLKNPFLETDAETATKFGTAFKGAGNLHLATSWDRNTTVYVYQRR